MAYLNGKEAAKEFEEQRPVQTDDGDKRFEETVTCPNDAAVTGSKKAQQAAYSSLVFRERERLSCGAASGS